jgi:hypothetical protein
VELQERRDVAAALGEDRLRLDEDVAGEIASP